MAILFYACSLKEELSSKQRPAAAVSVHVNVCDTVFHYVQRCGLGRKNFAMPKEEAIEGER